MPAPVRFVRHWKNYRVGHVKTFNGILNQFLLRRGFVVPAGTEDDSDSGIRAAIAEPEHNMAVRTKPPKTTRTYRCAKCGELGHNARTCPQNAITDANTDDTGTPEENVPSPGENNDFEDDD
jgi:hypothetical protein